MNILQRTQPELNADYDYEQDYEQRFNGGDHSFALL